MKIVKVDLVPVRELEIPLEDLDLPYIFENPRCTSDGRKLNLK